MFDIVNHSMGAECNEKFLNQLKMHFINIKGIVIKKIIYNENAINIIFKISNFASNFFIKHYLIIYSSPANLTLN